LSVRPIFLFALLTPVVCRGAGGANDGWNFATERNDVMIYSRPHPGSALKEFKAIGEIAAPGSAVREVLVDVDAYPSFMPYVAECRLLRREKDGLLSYQRMSPTICSDRDFALRTYLKSWQSADGIVYLNRWKTANELSLPIKPGVVRVPHCEGFWLLEPNSANGTRATYSVYTNIGGLIPPFIANHFSVSAIAEIFDAVRKQVKDPKYNSRAVSN
jgi:hypothetical protein